LLFDTQQGATAREAKNVSALIYDSDCSNSETAYHLVELAGSLDISARLGGTQSCFSPAREAVWRKEKRKPGIRYPNGQVWNTNKAKLLKHTLKRKSIFKKDKWNPLFKTLGGTSAPRSFEDEKGGNGRWQGKVRRTSGGGRKTGNS